MLSTPAPGTRRLGWRALALAVTAGVLLGALISVVLVRTRPGDTGIARADLIEVATHRVAGTSWALELETERAGFPLLVHLDEDGGCSLLFPDQQLVRLGAGERLRLPDPGGRRAWRSTGGEIFLTLASDPQVAVDPVFERAWRAAARAGSGEEARRRARRILQDQLGPGLTMELPDFR